MRFRVPTPSLTPREKRRRAPVNGSRRCARKSHASQRSPTPSPGNARQSTVSGVLRSLYRSVIVRERTGAHAFFHNPPSYDALRGAALGIDARDRTARERANGDEAAAPAKVTSL